jgi:hypothetical protein
MFLVGSVALQAPFVYRFWGGAFEAEDLGFVPASFDVRLARTMATFAALLGGAPPFIEECFPMG